jgi:hypothetical protein
MCWNISVLFILSLWGKEISYTDFQLLLTKDIFTKLAQVGRLEWRSENMVCPVYDVAKIASCVLEMVWREKI